MITTNFPTGDLSWSSLLDKILDNRLNLSNNIWTDVQRLSKIKPEGQTVGRIIQELVWNTISGYETKAPVAQILRPQHASTLVFIFTWADPSVVKWIGNGYEYTPMSYIFAMRVIDVKRDWKRLLKAIPVNTFPETTQWIMSAIAEHRKVYAISSKEHIDLLDYEEGDIIIASCYNYRDLIRNGYFPKNINGDRVLLAYLSGDDDPTLNFWYDRETSLVESSYIWHHISFEEAKNKALSSSDSIPLILYVGTGEASKQYLYSKSKRPKTDMGIFRKMYNHTRPMTSLIPYSESPRLYKVIVSGTEYVAIPVTRYASGMSRGLYYNKNKDKDPESFCGTFYYLEEESTVCLLALESRLLISFNKTTAYRTVTGDRSYKSNNKYVDMHIDGRLPQDLYMTAEEVSILEGSKRPEEISNEPRYAGYNLLYASEDELDQPLCIASTQKGIDVIILTHMVGSFQIVSEVLDTRSRNDSFRSLVYTY